MKHEKVIKREDGTKYRLRVNVSLSNYGKESILYRIDVSYKEKGKRLWKNLPAGINDWDFRSLPMEERREHEYKNILRFITKNEVYEAKKEAWELMKPVR